MGMPMNVKVHFAFESLSFELDASKRIEPEFRARATGLADPVEAVREGLENPPNYPALRRSLTPDDHVALVIEESLPHLVSLLTPILEHVAQAGVQPNAVTIICPASDSDQKWVEDLPEAFEDVRIEIHDGADRKKLSYLATTSQGQRVYLNRSAIDADQLIVLTGRHYDPLLGVAGGSSVLYPGLADEDKRRSLVDQLSPAAPHEADWPLSTEAAEIVWLLGAPFFVQIIEGAGDEIAHVLCGPYDSGDPGKKLLDSYGRASVSERADLVFAAIRGEPARHGFGAMARAVAAAARIVEPDGRIVLLCRSAPTLGPAAGLLRKAGDPRQALKWIKEQKPRDMEAAYQWALAANQARLFVVSGLSAQAVEELFATPIDEPRQVQKLVASAKKVAILEDAHKTMPSIVAQRSKQSHELHAK